MKRLKTKGMEVERRSRSRERRRRGSGEYQQPQDPRLQVFSSIPHFSSDRKVLLSPNFHREKAMALITMAETIATKTTGKQAEARTIRRSTKVRFRARQSFQVFTP